LVFITAKGTAFIRNKVPFARAWAAMNGIEIVSQERTLENSLRAGDSLLLETMLTKLKVELQKLHRGIYIERKETPEGFLAGFSIDWRSTKDWATSRKIVEPLADHCEKFGLFVVRSESRPYFDIYPFKVSKGDAFLILKKELGIQGKILYMGDSQADNPAFDLADISIGIFNRKADSNLRARFFLPFDNVSLFLNQLLNNNLVFREISPLIIKSSRIVGAD